MSKNPISLRVRDVQTAGGIYLPADARVLVQHYRRMTAEKALRPGVSFIVDEIPMTVNHMYKHSRFNTRLRPEVHQFRQKMVHVIDDHHRRWRPGGAAACVAIYYTPQWVTAKSQIRDKDVDNLVKPILDAYCRATGFCDKTVWSVSSFKALADRTFTLFYLFDVGDLVPRYRMNTTEELCL